VSELHPCPACKRHLKSEETSCPFCGAGLSRARPCVGGCSAAPAARLARAALVAAGAALLGAACSSQSALPPYGTPPHLDAGPEASPDAGVPTDGAPEASDDAK